MRDAASRHSGRKADAVKPTQIWLAEYLSWRGDRTPYARRWLEPFIFRTRRAARQYARATNKKAGLPRCRVVEFREAVRGKEKSNA